MRKAKKKSKKVKEKIAHFYLVRDYSGYWLTYSPMLIEGRIELGLWRATGRLTTLCFKGMNCFLGGTR